MSIKFEYMIVCVLVFLYSLSIFLSFSFNYTIFYPFVIDKKFVDKSVFNEKGWEALLINFYVMCIKNIQI